MVPNQPELAALRARVEAYAFDHPGDVVTFAQRLCREHRWSARLAARAIGEYRRFAILAAATGHRVTPSPIVDKVWHFHLTDTRRYWEEFCPHVLGRPLHHDPGRGGAAETRRHREQYRATLASYEGLFGVPPPPDIWPRPGASLRARAGRWASRGLAWIGNRPLAAALSPLAMALLVGCAQIFDSASPGAVQGPDFLVGYVVLIGCAAAIMAYLQARVATPAQRPTVSASELGAYELAYLAQGAKRVLETGLLRLYRGGFIRLDGGAVATLVNPLPANAPPIETAIGQAAQGGRTFSGAGIIAQPLATLRDRLEAARLVPDGAARTTAWLVAALVMGPVLVIGTIRLSFGQANHRPVGFLVMLMAAAVIGTILLTIRVMRVNEHGRAILREAKASLPRRQRLAPNDPQLLKSMALYGTAVLAAVGLTDFVAFAGQLNAGGGSDGGGGCSGGGGGCGGGCGG